MLISGSTFFIISHKSFLLEFSMQRNEMIDFKYENKNSIVTDVRKQN